MSILRIITLEYDGQRLDDMGNRVISAFDPLIRDFEVIKRLSLAELVLNFDFDQNRANFSPKVILEPLKEISDYQNPTLLLTHLPLLLQLGDNRYGVANMELKLAHVSTYRPVFGKLDSEEHVERVVIEALHELGHLFGLVHHKGKAKTYNDRLCPMTTAHGISVPQFITETDYISLRDTFFCGECYTHLNIPDPSLRLKILA